MKTQEDEFIRKRKARQKKARKRRRIRLTVFVSVLLLALLVVMSFTVLFPIKSISVTGSERYEEETVISECGLKKGDNILAASEKKCTQILREKLPYIKSVKFKRSLSGKLTIRITEAEEFRVYQFADKYYPVSDEDHILRECDQPPDGLTVIVANISEPKPGQDIRWEKDKAESTLSTIISAVEKQDLELNTVDLHDEVDIVLRVEGKFTARLGTANYLTEKINHLATVVRVGNAPTGGTVDLSVWTPENGQAIVRENDG